MVESCKTTKDQCQSRVDVFNAFMLDGLELGGYYQIPKIFPSKKMPKDVISFTDAIKQNSHPDQNTWVHFYQDDYKYERLWKRPLYYAKKLEGYGGIISPDYSLYSDFTSSQKIWNTYRNFTLGAWFQQTLGFDVITNVRTCGWDSLPYALAGVPKNSPIAISSHGCIKRTANRAPFINDLKIVIDTLNPSALLVYGSTAYKSFDYPKQLGIPITLFPSGINQRCREAHE